MWDFEFILSEERTSRKPDLIWKEKEKKTTRVCDMAYPRRRKRRKKKKREIRPHPETLSSNLGKDDPAEVLRKRYARSRFSKTTIPTKRSIVEEMRRTKTKFQ